MIRYDEGGWWFPDGEAHLQQWIGRMRQPCYGRLGYQCHKREAALRYVKQRRIAVDVGAHVGLFSYPLSHEFAQVIAFEPMPEHRDCFLRNMEGRDNWTLHPVALGPEAGEAAVRTRTEGSSGDTGVEPSGDGHRVEMRTLDSYGLIDVDFVKIDCEGYELLVLRGAVETLQRCRPVVLVEQKPETGGADRYGIGVTDGVRFLERLGYTRKAAIQGDYVMVP